MLLGKLLRGRAFHRGGLYSHLGSFSVTGRKNVEMGFSPLSYAAGDLTELHVCMSTGVGTWGTLYFGKAEGLEALALGRDSWGED